MKTPKIEREGGANALDFGDMKVEHVKNMMKLIETIVNIIIVETNFFEDKHEGQEM